MNQENREYKEFVNECRNRYSGSVSFDDIYQTDDAQFFMKSNYEMIGVTRTYKGVNGGEHQRKYTWNGQVEAAVSCLEMHF